MRKGLLIVLLVLLGMPIIAQGGTIMDSKFLTDKDLNDIEIFFLDGCEKEVHASTDALTTTAELKNSVVGILQCMKIKITGVEDLEDQTAKISCNMELLSRSVHYLRVLFPLYQFNFDTEEAIAFLPVWERARGFRMTSNFNEIYRVGLYELALTHGQPVARSVA